MSTKAKAARADRPGRGRVRKGDAVAVGGPTTPPGEAAPESPAHATLSLHWRWVRFLVLTGCSNAQIRASLTRDDLPCPGERELDQLRAEGPADSRGHARWTDAQIVKLGLAHFAQKTPQAEEALGILRDHPRVRQMVETMVIAGVPSKEIGGGSSST